MPGTRPGMTNHSLLRRPGGLALLAKARPALLRLGGPRPLLELDLELRQELRRSRTVEAAQRALGMRGRAGGGAKHLVEHVGERRIGGRRVAQLVREADAQRLLGA